MHHSNRGPFQMSEQFVTYEREGEIAIIGLNRLEKRNAFNDAVRDQLTEAAHKANLEARGWRDLRPRRSFLCRPRFELARG